MSRESMIAHLRQQGEETSARLWAEAKAKIEAQRAEAEQSLSRRRQEAAAAFAIRLDQHARVARMAAKRQAEQERIAGHHQLAERLRALAGSRLATLRTAGYQQTFARLVRELPALEWVAATVHPDDRGLAAAAFPKATIATDRRISGGLEVMGPAGRVRVVNTFEKRLERAWPQLLPLLLRALLSEVDDDRPAP